MTSYSRRDFLSYAGVAALTLSTATLSRRPLRHGRLGWNKQEARFRVRRVFATWANRESKAIEATNIFSSGQRVAFSLKPPTGAPGGWTVVANGQYDAELRAYFATLPKCQFAFNHEPENDSLDADAFRRAFDHVADLLPARIRPVVCLMAYTFSDAQPNGPAARWVPSRAQHLAVDAYNWSGTNTQPNAVWRSPEQLMSRVPSDLPVSVWETNCYEDPNDPNRKADWVRAWGPVAQAHRLRRVVFYDSSPDKPNDFVLFSSAQAAQAVADLVRHPYFEART